MTAACPGHTASLQSYGGCAQTLPQGCSSRAACKREEQGHPSPVTG